jgi:transcriptional regulator with XRE-family HTH domain
MGSARVSRPTRRSRAATLPTVGALPRHDVEARVRKEGGRMSGGDVSKAQQGDAAFGGMLRAFRRAAGLTHEELAQRSQVSVRTISDIERGRVRRPHRRSVQQLATALGLGASRLEGFLRAARAVPGSGTDRPGGSHSGTPAAEVVDEQPSAVVVMVLPLTAIGGSGPCCRRRRRCPQPRSSRPQPRPRHQGGARPGAPDHGAQPRTR